MSGLRVAVLVSGGGSNLQSIIDATERLYLKSKIVCVISNKEDAYGLERARQHKIEGIYIDPKQEAYDHRLLTLLQEKEIDLIVLAGYLKIISPSMIKAFPGQIINIHPSLLPKYGGQGYYGIHVHKAVIAAGEKYSGATVHQVDDGIDTGHTILQKSIPVLAEDTPETLQQRILEEVEHKILVEAILMIEENPNIIKHTR